MIQALLERPLRRRDGITFGTCLACYSDLSDPGTYCTDCGVKWDRVVLDLTARRDLPIGRGQSRDRYLGIAFSIQEFDPPFHDDDDDEGRWFERTYAFGSVGAYDCLRRYRKVNPEVQFRAVPKI